MPDRKEKKKFEERSESSNGGGRSSEFQNKKKFQDKKRFNASIVRTMVTLLQIADLERERKRLVQRKLTWCKIIQIQTMSC